jgi:hypothetical protein
VDISKLDPNLVAGIVTLLGTLVTYVVGKARGTKQADVSELLDEAITHEVNDALESNQTAATIESYLTHAALELGMKLKMKIPEPAVRLAVQWGVVAFKKALHEREVLQKASKDLGRMSDAAARIADKLATVGPNEPIDTITPFREAGGEMLGIGPDGKLGPVP